MASIQEKTVEGYGPYLYHVEWIGSKQKWQILGRADAVNVPLGPTDMTREEALEHRETPGYSVTIGELDDDMQEFAREFDDEDIESVINDMLLEAEHDAPRNILYAIKEVTDDDRLKTAIDDVTSHYVELNEKVTREQADYIEEQLGMRPFDMSITEPRNEYQDPMIQTDVDDVALTNNADLNAKLLDHATRITAQTKSGQQRLFEQWGDVLGDDRIVEFKRSLSNPDALGFTVPADVPATGNDSGRTPVTEIPYIGDAGAKDMHPDGQVLAVEDLDEMTDKQRAWLDIPVNRRELDKQTARGVARSVPELDRENTGDTLGHLLDMRDRRGFDGGMSWVDDANAFGVDGTGEFRGADDRDLSPVTNVDTSGEYVSVEAENGASARFSDEYWSVLDSMRDGGVTVEIGDGEPAFARLPDGSDVIVAPRQSND